MSAHINIFLLAQNRLLLEALTRILRKRAEFSVVHATAYSPESVGLIDESWCWVLPIDSSVKDAFGFQVVQDILSTVSGLKALMIGMDEDEETFLKAVSAAAGRGMPGTLPGNARSLSEVPRWANGDEGRNCEFGALLIEPFDVSRWRGVSNAGFMGFQSWGVADVCVRSHQRGALGWLRVALWRDRGGPPEEVSGLGWRRLSGDEDTSAGRAEARVSRRGVFPCSRGVMKDDPPDFGVEDL